MIGFKNQKTIRNLVNLENWLILDDSFLDLSLQTKIVSQRMLNDVMRNGSPSLEYCMKLLRHGPDMFTQFINILIEIKHNYIELNWIEFIYKPL